MSAEDTIKRFERIVAILIQLQSKRIVKAQEIADRFDVSLRTIYRDIRSLEAAGVPIYSEAGVGYSLVEGYQLPPIMFSRDEAGTFVAAEKLMQHFMDENLGRHFGSAMYKIKSVLKESQRNWLEAIQSNLIVSSSDALFNRHIPNTLEIIFEAIVEKNQVEIIYLGVDAERATDRKIEPVGLFHKNSNWYLLAYCHLRKDYRNFRTDRVNGINRTDIPFEKQHENLDYYLSRDNSAEVPKKTVRLSVERNAARFLKWERQHFGFVSEEVVGDRVEMVFECDFERNGFARWYLMFGDQVDIIAPEELKVAVKALLVRISERFEKNE